MKLTDKQIRQYRKEYGADLGFVRSRNLLENPMILDIMKSFKNYMIFRTTCGCNKNFTNYIKLGLYKDTLIKKEPENDNNR